MTRIYTIHQLKSYVFFISILISMEREVQCSNLDAEFCGVSKLTREVVTICPTDEDAWRVASERKQCSSYAGKCTRNLTYHCVINPWQNLTLEVCAPSTRIRAGHCAEYNKRGGKIQEFYLQNCKTCLKDYMSNEAYKYKECYTSVYKTHHHQQPEQQAQQQHGKSKNRDTSVNASSLVDSRNINIFCVLFLLQTILLIKFV
ncbi:uncharacterized protein LOC133178541 [Saccostrea echinata]|uniref:uncharacterized protein LOC133178541 n=1 Tax=Saccostrea echinata TaxID=191078 RepID=UPI002A80A80D|nr:uncharacterized protein LOC133178541 [Saccostrea echinata]